ncbi:hypothetical protein OAQ02_04020 [Candidatus Marinimicrobia bacterium]|nr:hypothetical protein [Candidatus Neomarinimicrobiota bacterium]
MKTKIDIELIVAYIKGEIKSSQKNEEICELIQTDSDWFSAYIDLKTSIVELENTKFEVTPDQLLNPKEEIQTKAVPVFDFKWLLKPQFGIGAACMFIVVVFMSLNREVDDFEFFSEPSINNLQMASDADSITKLIINDNTLKIFNASTDELSIFINASEYKLTMFDSLDIVLEDGDNHIMILNSNMETIKDTVINY